MSDKIKSKDLKYDTSLPPFLQRLHAQKAGRGDTDRHEREILRPKKAKEAIDDDGPTVIDESGETLSKEEYEKMTKKSIESVQDATNSRGDGDPTAEPKASGALPDNDSGKPRQEQKVTNGTAQKKRKAVKVVGEDAGEDGEDEQASSGKKVVKKAKKKAKPVKLAFNDDDDG